MSVIDYGMGNLKSVANAIEHLGHQWEIVKTPEEIQRATRLILPGVGAFPAAMERLSSSGLVDALNQRVLLEGIPILGICLGMQLFADKGYEHVVCNGLGWISGDVVKLEGGEGLKIPHMGWNELECADHFLLHGLEKENVYFVHSFHMRLSDPDQLIAKCTYGQVVSAAVSKGNIVGTQFHPEKSGKAGLRLLGNFLNWSPS